jgi:hypothetical protein
MERVVLVRSKTGVFHHFEWWKRGTYHKITMIYSLEPVKNELKHVFLQLNHPREPRDLKKTRRAAKGRRKWGIWANSAEK